MKKKQVDFDTLSAFTEPEESPGYLLWRVSTSWRSVIEDVLKKIDLTHPQFVVLATLGWLTRKGEKINQVEISRTAGIDPNTISQILRGLEAKKLIKRVQTLDERSKNPVLTELGRKKLTIALPAVESADEGFFKNLTTKETQLAINIFVKLIS